MRELAHHRRFSVLVSEARARRTVLLLAQAVACLDAGNPHGAIAPLEELAEREPGAACPHRYGRPGSRPPSAPGPPETGSGRRPGVR